MIVIKRADCILILHVQNFHDASIFPQPAGPYHYRIDVFVCTNDPKVLGHIDPKVLGHIGMLKNDPRHEKKLKPVFGALQPGMTNWHDPLQRLARVLNV